MDWIVELESGVWIADWEGDPGRTLKLENAQLFKSKKGAKTSLDNARKYRPFPDASIYPFPSDQSAIESQSEPTQGEG